MRAIKILVVCLLAAASAAVTSQRIVGGEMTSINEYPEMAALLAPWPFVAWYGQTCGGTLLNNRAVLSAAHCFLWNDAPYEWRIRLGSTYGNGGGFVYFTDQIIIHPEYNSLTYDSDVAILHTIAEIVFSDVISPGSIAGPNYNIADDSVVWAAGWGCTSSFSPSSEELRHVQMYTINSEICNERYAGIRAVTENMLCGGVLDVGGRDQCVGDSGSPLFHNGVVVGICSWRQECGHYFYPGVNARVSRYTEWIVSNA